MTTRKGEVNPGFIMLPLMAILAIAIWWSVIGNIRDNINGTRAMEIAKRKAFIAKCINYTTVEDCWIRYQRDFPIPGAHPE